MARRLGVPFRSGGALCGSKLPDAQSAYESANTLNTAFLSGVNFMLHSCGWLEGGLVSSLEKFLIDADQLGAFHSLAKGVDISNNGQALDAIRDVGPGGHFLGCDHTQKNFLDAFWRSDIFDYKPFETWSEEGERDTVNLAKEKVKNTLKNYEKPYLDPGIEENLIEYVQKSKSEKPDKFV